MTLSAYLGEATGDDKYIKAAEKSLAWIRNINMKDNLALDSITAKDCKHGADWYAFCPSPSFNSLRGAHYDVGSSRTTPASCSRASRSSSI